MVKRLSEDALSERFTDELTASAPFRHWLLVEAGFAGRAGTARLLDREQMALRPRRRWWRHWWCYVPDLNHQRETDIFCVFEDDRGRFALHVENKRGLGRFLPGQAEGYGPRAAFMAGRREYLDYAGFATILIAPQAFVAKFPLECARFDRVITHESIAAFIPEFAPA